MQREFRAILRDVVADFATAILSRVGLCGVTGRSFAKQRPSSPVQPPLVPRAGVPADVTSYNLLISALGRAPSDLARAFQVRSSTV